MNYAEFCLLITARDGGFIDKTMSLSEQWFVNNYLWREFKHSKHNRGDRYISKGVHAFLEEKAMDRRKNHVSDMEPDVIHMEDC